MPLATNFLCCILLILACTVQPPSVPENDRTVTAVEYSDDWNLITIYLDGAVAPKTNNISRAMTANNARRGFDCFFLQCPRKLLKDGNIDTVIGLPANLFFSTGILVCIIVLKKCKKHNDILFINAAEYFEKGKRQDTMNF
jgi:hypothetical protein